MSYHNVLEKTECSVCGSSSVESVVCLPEFPLTGLQIEELQYASPTSHDQELKFCGECGHLQLRYVLPPDELYGAGYSYRSSGSHIAPESSSFIVRYIETLVHDRIFDCILEVGCNDLLLLNKLSSRGNRLVGIDPIWKDCQTDVAPNIRVIGEFVEQVDFERELESAPDLIVSTHNLEHLSEPVEQYLRLMDAASEDALFVVEVPDADLMVNNLRFDQVFHQHIHYFGLASMLKLIEQVGGEYVGHTFNFRSWGGSLIVAFRKCSERNPKAVPSFRVPNSELVAYGYELFQERMAGFMRLVNRLKCDIWGYGAGQMIPALAYYLDSNLSFLKGILDDDLSRCGLTYADLPVRILQPDGQLDLGDAAVVITSLDAVRPIIKRLQDFAPRHILVPNNVF